MIIRFAGFGARGLSCRATLSDNRPPSMGSMLSRTRPTGANPEVGSAEAM